MPWHIVQLRKCKKKKENYKGFIKRGVILIDFGKASQWT